MKKKIKYPRLAALLLLFAGYAAAGFAQPQSLENILQEIEKNNLNLKAYDAQAKAYESYTQGARALDAPEIGAGLFMTPYQAHLWKADKAMGSSGMGSFMVSAEQMFMNPKKRQANASYMGSMSAMEQLMKESMKNELFSMAKMNYYNWIILKKKSHLLKESESILNYLIASTELRYKYGMDKLNAYYKAKGMLGDIQTMMAMTEQEISESIIGLNTLMNRPKNTLFEIDTLIQFKDYEKEPTDSNRIMQFRSDYKQLKQQETILKLKQSYEQSKLLPDFGIKYDHMVAFGKQPQQFSLMAMVSIPLAPWSAAMTKSTVKGLMYELDAARLKQGAWLNTINGNLEQLKVKIKNKKQQIELSEKMVIPAMKRNYETALLGYEQNTEELFMVLDAWQSLKLMQLTYIDQLMALAELQVQYENELEIK